MRAGALSSPLLSLSVRTSRRAHLAALSLSLPSHLTCSALAPHPSLKVWKELCEADNGKRLEPWFPAASGVREQIEAVLSAYPRGHPIRSHPAEPADVSARDELEGELEEEVEAAGEGLRALRAKLHQRLCTVAGRFHFAGIAETRAAVVIQASVRRVRARELVGPILEEARRVRASILIQSRHRGRSARRRIGSGVMSGFERGINLLEKMTGRDLDGDGDVGQ